jgi:hypothetical protein
LVQTCHAVKTHASRHEKKYVGVARSKDRDGGVFETDGCQTKRWRCLETKANEVPASSDRALHCGDFIPDSSALIIVVLFI